jgi:hypothetical protein
MPSVLDNDVDVRWQDPRLKWFNGLSVISFGLFEFVLSLKYVAGFLDFIHVELQVDVWRVGVVGVGHKLYEYACESGIEIKAKVFHKVRGDLEFHGFRARCGLYP